MEIDRKRDKEIGRQIKREIYVEKDMGRKR